MAIDRTLVECKGYRLYEKNEAGVVQGRAFLYVLSNELHDTPFGLIEDVFVEEQFRGQGIGQRLISMAIHFARLSHCYKVIATSRHSREEIHKFYENLGFTNHGNEFRIDLEK
jgi:GNAT superfamily N-acetyltransferase